LEGLKPQVSSWFIRFSAAKVDRGAWQAQSDTGMAAGQQRSRNVSSAGYSPGYSGGVLVFTQSAIVHREMQRLSRSP